MRRKIRSMRASERSNSKRGYRLVSTRSDSSARGGPPYL